MFDFATIPLAIAEKSFILLLNANFLRIHVYHQTTKAYGTREVLIIKTTNLNDNENLTIQLSTCQRTSHYSVIKMSTNISLSCYPNVNEYLTLRLSKCQQTSHYPVIKMSTNISLSVYHNVNEHLIIRLSKCPRTYHYHYDVVLTNKWDLINISLMDILTDCNEHLTMRLSKCPRTFHYPSIKISMNISLSGYQNAHEHLTIRLSKCH